MRCPHWGSRHPLGFRRSHRDRIRPQDRLYSSSILPQSIARSRTSHRASRRRCRRPPCLSDTLGTRPGTRQRSTFGTVGRKDTTHDPRVRPHIPCTSSVQRQNRNPRRRPHTESQRRCHRPPAQLHTWRKRSAPRGCTSQPHTARMSWRGRCHHHAVRLRNQRRTWLRQPRTARQRTACSRRRSASPRQSSRARTRTCAPGSARPCPRRPNASPLTGWRRSRRCRRSSARPGTCRRAPGRCTPPPCPRTRPGGPCPRRPCSPCP